ncbi:MAG: putative serine/threonine-protein kinase pknH [Labilithrix sp.]|nr:putative serine/threonine-protein kinase pknH [Labilithrix sp.]
MRLRSSAVAGLLGSIAIALLACGTFESSDPDPLATEEAGQDGASRADDGGGPDGVAPPVDAGGTKTTTTLASGLKLLTSIAADETTVYFAESATGTIHSVPLSGGVVQHLSPGGSAPLSIALVGNQLFWTDANPYSVNRISTLGGAVLTAPASVAKAPITLTASPDGVVVLTQNGNAKGDVQQYTRDLAPGPVVADVGVPFGAAIVGTDVYWSESGAMTIAAGKLGDNSRIALTANESDGESIAADALGIYWARPQTKEMRAKIAGGGFVTIAADEDDAASVCLDATHVYWVNTKAIRRYDRTSKTVETFATDFPPVTKLERRSVALTSKYVVWLTDDGRVLRRDK